MHFPSTDARDSRNLSTKDRFLIGMDLMKDEDVLLAAYNDSQNITASFTKNILVRLNR
jgi:L-histidine N-alpha-methyltransferase